MHFGHKSRAITLLFLNEIIPLTTPYHSFPITMSMQSLKKIGHKVLKLEHGNEALTDRQTDRQTLKVWRVQHNTPSLLKKIGTVRAQLEHRNEAQSIFDIHQGP